MVALSCVVVARIASIVVSALRDHDALIIAGLALDHVDESMLAGDPARPEALEFTLEWLWFPYPGERRSPRILDQIVEALMRVAVVIAPVEVIVPAVIGEMDPQALFRGVSGAIRSRFVAPSARI